ncbi:hypothetical protein [Halorarum halobium]|uniref:hypothetical protein n=1 Tax=Halorarum halobium TaxID=3075121 RepID=UPI0028AF0736|nr:hypothetical protein [Halobaculum sp. XH14]
MVEERTTDGVRIAQLLASELTGGGGHLADVTVADADPDVAPAPDGALAYRVRPGTDDEPLADAFVHPDRARVEFRVAPDVAAEEATEAGLRVRPKAVRPPRTVVFLEDGAEVKRVLPAFGAVVRAVAGDAGDRGPDDG